jgi:hypothetical protein
MFELFWKFYKHLLAVRSFLCLISSSYTLGSGNGKDGSQEHTKTEQGQQIEKGQGSGNRPKRD